MIKLRDSIPPDPALLAPARVLLASEGREIPREAVALATDLARRGGGEVLVLSLARIWGTGLGLPMPGLLPSKAEWDEQHRRVRAAVKALERRGLKARGRVIGTRKGARRIVAEAERLDCEAIVMGGDPRRSRFLADFMWSQEPYRVRRRSSVPVYVVESPTG